MQCIARKLYRSSKFVSNYLKSPNTYFHLPRTGRERKLSDRYLRMVVRDACEGEKSLNDLRKNLDNKFSRLTIRRILSDKNFLVLCKMLKAPNMTENINSDRLEWEMEMVGHDYLGWWCVIFSDEEKFDLDGPDGFASYWYDIQTEPMIFYRRKMSGQYLMV